MCSRRLILWCALNSRQVVRPDLALLGTSQPSCRTPPPPPFRLKSVTRGLQSVVPLLEHFTQPLTASVWKLVLNKTKVTLNFDHHWLNKVTTRWEGPQSLSYHKQSLGNEKRWASVCTLMFNQFLTSNQSYVHKKFMLLNEFIVLIRRGDDISSCFHLKDDL